MHHHPAGSGKSSFDLVDIETLFSRLKLKGNCTLLDLGCGRGAYSIAASERIGEHGLIYAVDLWEEGIDHLKGAVAEKRIGNIRAILGDAAKRLPIADQSVDACLMATVFHDLVQDKTHERALAEIKRTLKPGGALAVIEFKKIEGPPGPPERIRVSPEELEAFLHAHGFLPEATTEIGAYTYLSVFTYSGRSEK